MSTPRWGHKPPPVHQRDDHWNESPAAPSDRMAYWVRRWRMGEWEPNRWLLRECADCRSSMLGVWVWEARFVLHPLTELRDGKPAEEIAAWVARFSDVLPGPYWTVLEERSRYGHRDPDQSWRDDLLGELTDAMERAVKPPPTLLGWP